MNDRVGSSPVWSTLRHLARIVLLGVVLGVVLFGAYLALPLV